MDKIFLNVPFCDKDKAKALGARWDWDNKKWYCSEFNKDAFTQWLPATCMTYDDLSDEQQEVIDVARTGENVLVDACIGSGKTTTIQVMCNELSDKKILYMTFNRLLKVDAQAKITSPNTLVTNYDGFAYKSLKDNGYATDTEKNIRLFNRFKPHTGTYDLLILDEYQDIREDIADMLTLLKERNPKMQIIAVGDMQQKIYNFTALDIKTFIKDYLGDHKQLNFTKCFRLSREHAKKLGHLWGKKITGVNTECETRVVSSLSDVVNFLKDKDPKDILVLGSRTGDVAKVLNTLEDRYPEKFNKNTVYASIKEEESFFGERNNIAIFTTFDASKGLERKYCVVLDWTEEYWRVRAGKPDTNYDILRNLFLVGASRGKSLNMFFDNPMKARNILSNVYYDRNDREVPFPFRFANGETLMTSFAKPYSHEDPFNASEMYGFKYAEDIAKCSELIELKVVNNVLDPIDVKHNDGNIDITPCVGKFVEASFFKDYDIDKEKDMVLLNSDAVIKPRIVKLPTKKGKMRKTKIEWSDKNATVEDKTLMLIGAETGQDRYTKQVDVPFVTADEKVKINERLSSLFTGKEEVQTALEIDFYAEDSSGYDEEYQIHGICDVVKDNIIYELKFTDELKETHFLQLAFYLCAYEGKRGILWNVKTNEMIEVIVPDKMAFLKQTVRAISKRNLEANEFFLYDANKTRFTFNEVKKDRGSRMDAVERSVRRKYA